MDLPSYVSSAIGVSVEVKDLIMTYNGIVTPHFQDLAELPTSQRLAWTLSETAIREPPFAMKFFLCLFIGNWTIYILVSVVKSMKKLLPEPAVSDKGNFCASCG